MPKLGKINYRPTGDMEKSFLMYKIELERKLNYLFDRLTLLAKDNTVYVTLLTDTATLTNKQQGFIECNKATAMTVNLPTAVGIDGLGYSITSINTGTVTIEPFGSETLQGDANFDIYEDENLQIISNGTNWTVG